MALLRDADVRGPHKLSRVTLGDLAAVPGLRLRWVLHAGIGASRVVRWASTTELLDPSRYLKGGELVCTVGSMLTDDSSCHQFVTALSSAGVTGLCFGTGDVHATIPAALVDACATAELPLVEAPPGAPFIAISEHLAGSLVAAQATADQVRQRLVSRLLAQVRTRAPLVDLLAITGDAVGGRLDVVTEEAEAARPGREDGAVRVPLAQPGTSLRWRGEGDPPSTNLLEQVARVVDVSMSELDIEATLGRERAGQLLDLVGSGLAHPVALRPLLDAQGVEQESMVASAWTSGAAALLVRHLPTALVGEMPNLTIAVTQGVDEVLTTAAALALPCGYGSRTSLVELGRSITEARAALTLAQRAHTPMGPESLTTLAGLLELQPPQRLRPFVDQIIQPLVECDNARRTNHVETLRTFLRLDGRLQATATELFVHVNTVRHRLTQIHEMTGRDPMVLADRMALMVALWAFDHQQPLGGPPRAWGRRT
ncbi:MAG TPA: PucR family transcriptional regulator [Actinomycetales bacterium]|nr:PucR family transcriptional regulator [Actinomycetales bacterium]